MEHHFYYKIFNKFQGQALGWHFYGVSNVFNPKSSSFLQFWQILLKDSWWYLTSLWLLWHHQDDSLMFFFHISGHLSDWTWASQNSLKKKKKIKESSWSCQSSQRGVKCHHESFNKICQNWRKLLDFSLNTLSTP